VGPLHGSLEKRENGAGGRRGFLPKETGVDLFQPLAYLPSKEQVNTLIWGGLLDKKKTTERRGEHTTANGYYKGGETLHSSLAGKTCIQFPPKTDFYKGKKRTRGKGRQLEGGGGESSCLKSGSILALRGTSFADGGGKI